MDMRIAVTGGKGGVGKTSVAVSLAEKLKSPLFIDADVEMPDAKYLLGIKTEKKETVLESVPELDPAKCIKCGKCSEICPTNALAFIPGKPPFFFEERCVGCGLCIKYCPTKALSHSLHEIGEIRRGEKKSVVLYEGISRAGIEETSKIVKKLFEVALEEEREFIIIDTPAGIHCNVVRALLPSDLVIIVTEPTPYGLHDLKKITKLVKKMGKKAKIVINKEGLSEEHTKKIEKFSERESIEIVARIPFSEQIIRNYSKGVFRPIVSPEEIL